VAALALDDREARAWLSKRQRADGGFDELDGRPSSPASASLAALALEGRGALAALAFVLTQRMRVLPGAPPPDDHLGWGWASDPDDARTFVEPTARALAALKARTPENANARAEAVRALRALQCADGGWNYGTASVNAVDLRGYAQTTAIALVGLQGEGASFVARGMVFLRRAFRGEPGGLTAAQSLLAFRIHGVDAEFAPALETLESIAGRESFLERPAAIGWAVLATGADAILRPLRSRA
jgi:hypothetical protein